MRTQRGLVDYTLQRRGVLARVRSGKSSLAEVCDAPEDLMRAARFHGVATELPCPVCRKENLTHVYWIFGEELGASAGSAREPEDLDRLEDTVGEFTVRQVEVCRSCSWNHLVRAFVLGHSEDPDLDL